ncbi:hypothetical protein JW911_03320 [Candidatus Peregrinibacteria bacterium]|nr:hypothetical protein [Candidatus Peregrinibacteria bacterium]
MKKMSEIWIGVWVCFMIATIGGCNDHDDCYYNCDNTNYNTTNTNNNTSTRSTRLTVASTGHIAVMTSEYSAQDNFLPSQVNVAHTLTLVRPAVMIVSGEDRLAVDAEAPMEIWTVPSGNLQVFIQLLQSYYANSATWTPDLFPASWSESRDFQWILSLFACSPQVNRPELAPSGCPTEGAIPNNLFQLVSSNGYDDWNYPGAVQFRLVYAR